MCPKLLGKINGNFEVDHFHSGRKDNRHGLVCVRYRFVLHVLAGFVSRVTTIYRKTREGIIVVVMDRPLSGYEVFAAELAGGFLGGCANRAAHRGICSRKYLSALSL